MDAEVKNNVEIKGDEDNTEVKVVSKFVTDKKFIMKKLRELLTNSMSFHIYSEPILSNDTLLHEQQYLNNYPKPHNELISPFTREKLITHYPVPIIQEIIDIATDIDPTIKKDLFIDPTLYSDNVESVMSELRNGKLEILDRFDNFQFTKEMIEFLNLFLKIHPSDECILRIYNNSNLKNSPDFFNAALSESCNSRIHQLAFELYKNNLQAVEKTFVKTFVKNYTDIYKFKLLLDWKPELINIKINGDPLLFSTHHSYAITKLLIQRGADINERTSRGYHLILYTIDSKNKEITNYIIQHLSDININPYDQYNQTTIPIFMIMNNFELSTIHACLQKGYNINAQDHKGRTLLHHMLEKYDAYACTSIIEAGADLEISDKYGRRPIHIAAQYQTVQLISEMLFRPVKLIDIFCADHNIEIHNIVHQNNKLDDSEKVFLAELIIDIAISQSI
jgi:ankyrin repeat protein